MKAIAIVTLLAVLSPGLLAQTRQPRIARPARKSEAAQEALPVRRIILYSNGVAYFERRGSVSGNAKINLSFKQSQVNDVLKSMIVLDRGKGKIGAVSYNSSAPPSARLQEIPFSIDAGAQSDDDEDSEPKPSGGLASVLGQLQGARVQVATANRAATGAILTVETRSSQKDKDHQPAVRQYLVIASDTGEISSFDLEDVRSIRLLDEGTRKDLSDFAEASASARRRDAKTIVVTSDGEGQREMVVSYTIAAPIWKTTYRVVIDSTGKPFFQGWAIVDNVSDEDWTDVQLSLVSGTPVSFIQPLQQPLYRYRPVIPIPENLNLTPQVYEPGTGYYSSSGVTGGVEGGVPGSVPGGVPGGMPGGIVRAPSSIPAPPPPPGPTTTLSDEIADEESGVEAEAEGSEVGDLFEYRIERPMTVRRNRSALIPILQTRMEGERVSIFNLTDNRDRPMGGLKLKNTSSLTLEGGSLTVIDGDSYAGEALIERLKPGEERFISFAVDLGTMVSVESSQDREPVFMVRATGGVIQAHYHRTAEKTYSLTNQTDHARIVYVEHSKRDHWKLSDDTPEPDEETESFYRFRVEVEPRETAELRVVEHQVLMDSYTVSNIRTQDVEMFVSNHYIDQAMRAALDNIIAIREKIGGLDNRLAASSREAAEIATDQARLRENIKALKDTVEARQLIARYVAKADEQETRIEQITDERKKMNEERARFQSEMDSAIRALSFDRKLKD